MNWTYFFFFLQSLTILKYLTYLDIFNLSWKLCSSFHLYSQGDLTTVCMADSGLPVDRNMSGIFCV